MEAKWKWKEGGNVLEKLINASFGQASREEWVQYRPEVAEIFPRTRESHAGKRIGSAMRTIASPPLPPSPLPPRRSHSWWKSSVHGGNGVAGYGGRIPAEINSQRRGIHSVYLRRSRNRFRAIISATLQNDRATPRRASLLLPPSRSTPRVPIKLHSVSSWLPASFIVAFLSLERCARNIFSSMPRFWRYSSRIFCEAILLWTVLDTFRVALEVGKWF